MLFVCDPGVVYLPSALVKLWCTDALVWKDGKILNHLSTDTVVNAILRYTQEHLFFYINAMCEHSIQFLMF